MNLCFDTETTGLFDKRAPADAAHQPKPVRVAGILFDEDEEKGLVDLIVRPEGWQVPKEASDIHGISHEDAMRYGVPLKAALSAIVNMQRVCRKLIGFNTQFDIDTVRSGLAGLGTSAEFPRPGLEIVDVMRLMVPVCRIQHDKPRHDEDWRFPKLIEVARHFDLPLRPHDPLSDLRATYGAWRRLEKMRLTP